MNEHNIVVVVFIITFFFLLFIHQLNASVTFAATENDDRITTNSEDSDLEDQLYQDFLTRAIETSDTEDENFVCELNGDDISDTDSQSSVATEDLSDYDDDDATDEGVTNVISIRNDKIISEM